MKYIEKNQFYYFAGIAFLLLSKIKNILQGYSSPKPFSIGEVNRNIEYDISVVDNWIEHLYRYKNGENSLRDKRILELGPGSDLGTGLYLLSKNAGEYNAVDVNNLVKSVPSSFYEKLFTRLKKANSDINESFLRDELHKAENSSNGKLNYVCRNDFNIAAALNGRRIDIIFSQAAFEHFENIDNTIHSISDVAVKGAVIVAQIDLKTHSRWIRDKDPNNIYRYPTWLYNLFGFRGIPNRVRPYKYKETFEKYGWGDVKIEPNELLSRDVHEFEKKYLNSTFYSRKNQMHYLSVWLYATKL